MKISKLLVALIFLSIAGTAYFYRLLPEEIALHYNYKGEVDNWGNRNFIWLTSSLPLLIYILMALVPKIDPRKDSYDKHKRGYSILAHGITLFLIAMNWFTILQALGKEVNIQKFILTAIGILFILIGNHLPNARQNYTFGIRTPWTLANETSWKKTHRLGGYGFMVSGLVAIAGIFLPGSVAFFLFFIVVIIMVILLTIYSYMVFRKNPS